MKFILNYSKYINEKLGVPDNILETAEYIYNELINHIKKDDDFDGVNEYYIDYDFNISDLNFKGIKIKFELHTGYTETGITHMYLRPMKYRMNYNTFKSEVYRKEFLIGITMVCDEFDFDLIEYLEDNKIDIIKSLTHELKHLYDRMKNHRVLNDTIEYKSYTSVRFGIKAIDDLLYKLYYINKIENKVRSSELYSSIKLNKIKDSEFKEFLNDDKLIVNLRDINKFTYEGFRKILLNDISNLKYFLYKNDFEVPERNDDVLDLILRLLYINIRETHSELLKGLLYSDDEEDEDYVLSGDKLKYYVKNIKKFDNDVEKYFVDIEKRFKFESNKLLKNIYKLYDLTIKTNQSELMDKINKKDGK